MKKNLILKISLFTMAFALSSFARANPIDELSFEDNLFTWDFSGMQDIFATVTFQQVGNNFGGTLFWHSIINLSSLETISLNGSTKDCKQQIRWLYYNNQRWLRIWPLDESSLDVLTWIDSSYEKLNMTWWLYIWCDDDYESIYWNITYDWSGEIFELIAGVDYDFADNQYINIYSGSLKFVNWEAIWYIYDSYGGIWTVEGTWLVNVFSYIIQTWPEKRAQAWVNWTITYPNLRTRSKIWIYSWHVLLYTWEVDMWWWGTWEIQMNGILSWTYDITFEWLNNPRVMLSGIVLANTDRLIDFTTWDNTLWEYLNDVNLSAWYPYTWNYMYVWDLTWTSLNKTQRINSDDMWVLVWEYTKWLSYSNFGLDPYDLNADWTIDAWDFAMMVVNWNNAIQTITDNDYPWIQF